MIEYMQTSGVEVYWLVRCDSCPVSRKYAGGFNFMSVREMIEEQGWLIIYKDKTGWEYSCPECAKEKACQPIR